MALLSNFIEILLESAPWLLLGFLVAGLMKAWLPENWLARHLGKPGFASTVKASLMGAPLPLCSCGVIPAAMGLRRAGASKGATTSFLISTPETGVDSISISYALLGPVMAVTRPIAAIASAITAGLLVGKEEDTAVNQAAEESSCCSKSHSDQHASKSTSLTWLQRLRAGLRFTFVNLLRDIAIWLLIGLLMAAVIRTFVPTEFLLQWGDGLMAFVVMALIGVPMYICATASTPIAAGLLFAGLSPGAVLVFLLVGPATNMATLGVVKQELGKRALSAYLLGVIGVAFIFGYALNLLANYWQMDFLQQAEHVHNLVNPMLSVASALALVVLIMHSLMTKPTGH